MGVYKQLFDVYSKYYDTSGEAFTTLKEQLSRQSDNQVIDRKNFLGHFTASTFVVSKSTYHVALVHHNFLGKYLQPGGHIDESDSSPLDAAQRELQEETGINSAHWCAIYTRKPKEARASTLSLRPTVFILE